MLSQARDTFLHFIADNLPTGTAFHYLHRDPNDPASELLKTNAVNVEFNGMASYNLTDMQYVSIDVVADYDDDAVTWVKNVVDLLRSAYYTPLYNYTVPTAPVPVRGNVMWPRAAINFRKIHSDNYSHYSCQLTLEFIL